MNSKKNLKIKAFHYLLILSLMSGCAAFISSKFDKKYGKPHPQNRLSNDNQQIHLWEDAQQVLHKRCIVCHGCYDAPCQLRLGSVEGIERGANKDKLYDGRRLFAATPTRLFTDAFTTEQWRKKNFYPILNERVQTPQANLDGGLMARMIELKNGGPLPNIDILPTSFTFSIDREQQCPTIDEFDDFAVRHLLWGMPYGLPALPNNESKILIDWLQQGSKHGPAKVLPVEIAKRVSEWDIFLNGESNKEKLMSRYLYEHLFISNLYFDNFEKRIFYRLVRSRTGPGQQIDIIATRYPYDAPKVDKFYYRLKRVKSSVLSKTHIPYPINESRRQRWHSLFLSGEYDVNELPNYDAVASSNPFITFKDIPVKSRYRFLLDDAKAILSGFIKGPVCRGQIALDVINDRFWVFFVNPDSAQVEHDAEFLAQESDHLRMPNEQKSSGLNVASWYKYSKLHKSYLLAKEAFYKKTFKQAGDISLKMIWDGDGKNDNAALTVFRHFDNATIVKGLVGQQPKTSWLIGYPLLERIHYLLVAGFDVYGNVRHQLEARLYMDFLRMEGEYNFLLLLPRKTRAIERDYWYRGAHDYVKDYINWGHDTFDQDTGITYQTKEHKKELYRKLTNYTSKVNDPTYLLTNHYDKAVVVELDKLSQVTGIAASLLPEISFLTVLDHDREESVFTLIRNSAHSNISHLFSETTERLKDEDSLTIVRGFIGAYPNVFLRVNESELGDFVSTIISLSNENGYRSMLDRFGIRRTSAEFWKHSDKLHTKYRNRMPIEAGLFDYNRLENR